MMGPGQDSNLKMMIIEVIQRGPDLINKHLALQLFILFHLLNVLQGGGGSPDPAGQDLWCAWYTGVSKVLLSLLNNLPDVLWKKL